MTWQVEPGRKAEHEISLPAAGGDDAVRLPVLLARGHSDGPTVAVLGGVHGDEYEGVAAAGAVWRELDPKVLRGLVIVLPIANPPAFEAGARSGPVDGKNLARTFPGDPAGTFTDRIAWAISERVIRQADFLIDLHSAGQHYEIPLLAGSLADDTPLGRRCQEAALAFGAPVYWGHPVVAPGRSLSVALDAGIPCLYAECGGGGRIREADLTAYRSGVRSVLEHLGLLPLGAPPLAPRVWLRSSGDTDEAIPAAHGGLLVNRVTVLQTVEEGQLLGEVLDERGRTIERVTANRSGVVVMARRTARLRPSDGLYLVAQVERAPATRTLLTSSAVGER